MFRVKHKRFLKTEGSRKSNFLFFGAYYRLFVKEQQALIAKIRAFQLGIIKGLLINYKEKKTREHDRKLPAKVGGSNSSNCTRLTWGS